MEDRGRAPGPDGERNRLPGLQIRALLDAVDLARNRVEFEGDRRGRLVGEPEFEALRGVSGKGTGDVFEEVTDPIAVEIAVFRDEVDIPFGSPHAPTGLIQHPLLPRIGQPIAVCIDPEVQVEPHPLAAGPGTERAADFDRVQILAVDYHQQRVHALRLQGARRINPGAGVPLVDTNLQLIIRIHAQVGINRGAADFLTVAQEDNFRAIDAQRGAHLIADDSKEGVVGRGRVGLEARSSEHPADQHQDCGAQHGELGK